ncbi:MAG: hypothetical protein Q9226_002710 [Calogaya cf. arnoldii]
MRRVNPHRRPIILKLPPPAQSRLRFPIPRTSPLQNNLLNRALTFPVPVVKQWSVPLCFGSGSSWMVTVSLARRRSGEVLGVRDWVALIEGGRDGRAFVLVGRRERRGMRAKRSDVTVL